MGVGPGVPAEGDLAAGRDGGVEIGVPGLTVAGNVGSGESAGGDEAEIGSTVGPRDTALYYVLVS